MPEYRSLSFASLDDALAEVESLASGEARTTGRFSFAQILRHLALTLDMVSGHIAGPKLPWFIRFVGPLIKKSVLSKPIKPGFKLPKTAQSFFWPAGDIDLPTALNHFRESLARYRSKSELPRHPIFGSMTREEHDLLQRGHMALHLGFVHPVR
jgi:Protein of unknown function (DUF1569)